MSRFAGIAAVAAVAVGVGVAAQQEMLPRPGPGSGVTPVSQRGNWDVAISNEPTVHIANPVPVRIGVPAFVRNASFEITWANGDKETVAIVGFERQQEARIDRPDGRPDPRQNRPQPADDGWVQVRDGSKTRWINLTAARSIEQR